MVLLSVNAVVVVVLALNLAEQMEVVRMRRYDLLVRFGFESFHSVSEQNICKNT